MDLDRDELVEAWLREERVDAGEELGFHTARYLIEARKAGS